MTNIIVQIIYLMRFLCLLAIFYLALHKLIARLSRKPNSKVIWFFATLTAPLTLPVKTYSSPDATDDQIVTYSLIFYGLVWMLLIYAGRYWIK